MENQQLREQLAAELKRQRLPAGYIERLLAEWDDHLADLEDERNIDMPKARTPESNSEKSQTEEIYDFQQRMGDPAQLAVFAAKQYRNRSFLGRHPMLTFLVLPLPLIVLGVTAVMVAMYPIGTALDYYWPVSNYHHPWLLGPAIAVIFWILIVMPPFCSMLLLCRIARRNLVKMRWVVMASVIVAMYCAQIFIVWNPPSKIAENDMVSIGYELFPSSLMRFAAYSLPKFVLAMSICLLLVRRTNKVQQDDENRTDKTPLHMAA
jgi:hypothetical protein